MKDGRLQRFCQQCGRFHDLSAFDGNRKSCREQLQKHNARRRRRAQLEQSASLAGSLVTAVDEKSEVGKLLQGLLANPFQLQALRVLLGVKTHPALPEPQGYPAEHEAALAARAADDAAAAAAAAPAGTPEAAAAAAAAEEAAAAAAAAAGGGGAAGASSSGSPPSYEVARDIMEGSGPYAPDFDSDHRCVKLCLKMFNATPADLPPDLKAQVTGWLSSAPAGLESHIRPGCVMLTAQMLVDEAAYADARARGLQRLLENLLAPGAHAFWRTTTYIVQLFDAVAVVANGALVSAARLGPAALAAGRLPAVAAVSPPCVAAAAARGAGGADAPAPAVEFVVHGSHLDGAGTSLVVRSASRALPAATAPAPGGGALRASLPAAAAAPPPGGGGARLVWVEAARGAFHSDARPLLVVSDPAIAAEVARLEALAAGDGGLRPWQVDALLVDLCLVLQHIGQGAADGAPEAGASSAASGRCCAGGAACDPSHAAGAAACPGLSHHAIVEKARRLLAFACDQGWAGVAAAVLPLASARCACAADIVAAIHEATAHDGLSLLHRAVRSGSLPLVRGMLEWGAARGYRWDVGAGGPLGISPLHLAALLDDDAAVLLALLDACDGGGAAAPALPPPPAPQACCGAGAPCCGGGPARCACCAFTRALTDDGVSPFHLSLQHGHFSVDRVLAALRGPAITRVTERKLQLAGWELLRAAAGGGDGAAPAGGRGGLGGGRQTAKLDACLYCQSTLPPLLLSIKAHCAGCGERQPCAGGAACGGGSGSGDADASNNAAAGPGAAPAAPARSTRGGGGRAAAAPAPQRAAAAAAAAVAGGPAECAHQAGKVLSVTALCQTCHANRTLQVA
jgi:hypothetical protein